VRIERLQATLARLQESAGALAALGAMLAARIENRPIDARLLPALDATAAALGVADAVRAAERAALEPLVGELRTFALLNARLLFDVAQADGWTYTDERLLQAAGDASAGFAALLRRTIAPALDSLAMRLEAPDACFLDIGCGVGGLSIGMAREWPRLRITGIDPWPAALDRAQCNVAAADLVERIALRRQFAEAIDDRDAFDLVWLPGAFLPQTAIVAALPRVLNALRPSGWLIMAHSKPADTPLADALVQLRAALFGGSALRAELLAARLREAGFQTVRALPSTPNATVAFIAGRRS
jgi:precorrin-6B methylase 2